MAISTSLEKYLVQLCCSPTEATLSVQLSGQLKSLQTGIWNRHTIKSALASHLFFAVFSLLYVPKKNALLW